MFDGKFKFLMAQFLFSFNEGKNAKDKDQFYFACYQIHVHKVNAFICNEHSHVFLQLGNDEFNHELLLAFGTSFYYFLLLSHFFFF